MKKLSYILLSGLLGLLFVIGFFVSAQDIYDCSTLVSGSLDKSSLTIGESLTLTYSSVDPDRFVDEIFWYGTNIGILGVKTDSSPEVYQYNIAAKNLDITLHLEQVSGTGRINCKVSPLVNVHGICGNGTKEWDEDCDDGGVTGNGCSSSCERETPSCSNLTRSISPTNGSLSLTTTASYAWNGSSGFSPYRIYWGEGPSSYTSLSSSNGSRSHTYNPGTFSPKIRIRNNRNTSTHEDCSLSTIKVSSADCSNNILEPGEECIPTDPGCTNSCTLAIPDCSVLTAEIHPMFGPKPMPTTGTFEVSSSWVNLGGITWEGTINSPITTTSGIHMSSHTYVNSGIFIPVITLQNIGENNTVENSCSLSGAILSGGKLIWGTNPLTGSAIEVVDAICGNDAVEPGEQCDDGNVDDGDGCSSICEWETPSCETIWMNISGQKGYIPDRSSGINSAHSFIPAKVYANFAINNNFGVNSFSWGDGSAPITIDGSQSLYRVFNSTGVYVATVTGVNLLNTGYVGSCTFTLFAADSTCGDGNIEGFEQCDDGNNIGGDGCSADTCQFEYPNCNAVNLSLNRTSGNYPLDIQARFSINSGFTASSFSWGEGSSVTGSGINSPMSHRYESTYSGPISVTLKNNLDESYVGTCKKNIAITKKRGGGGRISTRLTKDDCPNGDYSDSYYDKDCGEKKKEKTKKKKKIKTNKKPITGIGCRYSDEPYIDRGYFTDTLTHTVWGFEYIEQMRINCIHRGRNTPEGKWLYHPKASITKAEVMKTMVKIMGIARQDFNLIQEEVFYPGKIVFYDVPVGHWASWYTEYAKKNKIVEGFYKKMPRGDRFDPDNIIDRYGVIKMIIQAYEIIHGPLDLPYDFETRIPNLTVTDPYFLYITKAEYLGFVEGRNYNGTFKLEGEKPVTREEFAKMTYLAFKEYFVIDVDNLLEEDSLYQQIQEDLKDPEKAKEIRKNVDELMKLYREKPSSFFEEKFGVTKIEFMQGLYNVLYHPKKEKTLITSIYDI